jgi:hypothetical protein
MAGDILIYYYLNLFVKFTSDSVQNRYRNTVVNLCYLTSGNQTYNTHIQSKHNNLSYNICYMFRLI